MPFSLTYAIATPAEVNVTLGLVPGANAGPMRRAPVTDE
jgi:hypothetical protein